MKVLPRVTAIVVGLIACSLAAISCSTSPSISKARKFEPVYKGKPLTDWVMMFQEEDRETEPWLEATEAMQIIGPSAIPFLLKWIQPPYEDDRLYNGTVDAFRALGPQAQPAIPELAKLVNKYKPPHSVDDRWIWNKYPTWSNGIEALSFLGPDALPILLKAANQVKGYGVKWEVIMQLGNFGTNGAPAIPALLNWSRDPDPSLRAPAISALGQIGLQPERVVPVLRAALNDPDALVRRKAEEALGE